MVAEQTPIPEQGTQEYIDYVVNLAKGPVMRDGIINEPRVFFDLVDMPADQEIETAGNPEALVNGEDFPIRITHMTACVRFLNSEDPPVVDDQFNIQTIGMRLQFHDQFYMNPAFLAVPVWGNKVVASSDTVSFGTSSWDFVSNGQPFVLSARDTLQVRVQLNNTNDPQAPIPVTVTFTGFGMLSKRPYLMSSTVQLAALGVVIMPVTDFRNDGSEPIVITDMTVNVASELGATDPTGRIGRVSLNVNQVGNGTNALWFKGPVGIPNMQATLLGVTSGRAVCHRFPGDGLIWEPGEGIQVAARPTSINGGFDSNLLVGFAGYIMIV